MKCTRSNAQQTTDRKLLPDDFLAIDEMLYPTRRSIWFKKDNEEKPAKYGLNSRSLGRAGNTYDYYTIPHCGKPVAITDSYIEDFLTLVKRIVEGYKQNNYPLRVFNISMDRYYTSIPLAKRLYSKHITCVGTLQTNRKGLPKEIKETKGREKNSWIACKELPVTSISVHT